MTPRPVYRVVVIGASNVARSGSVVPAAAEAAFGTPLDLLLAAGHGRALGKRSSVLGRELPPVLECGIWRALESRESLPATAILTDIGTDLVYGAQPATVARRLLETIERLKPHVDRLAMSRLPLASVERLHPRTFRWFRTVFFPTSRITFEDALQGARELDARVVELADAHEIILLEPASNWYGWDPIHVLRKHQIPLWENFFSATIDHETKPLNIRRSLRDEVLLRTCVPDARKLFGWQQSGEQPAFQSKAGSQVSLY